jgi:hypothetical protein
MPCQGVGTARLEHHRHAEFGQHSRGRVIRPDQPTGGHRHTGLNGQLACRVLIEQHRYRMVVRNGQPCQRLELRAVPLQR